MGRPPLIVIAGPTAAGKSGLAVKLAGKISGSIISADSVQVYRGLDIGSAKITGDEMRGIPHALIDVADPSEDFTVADYAPMAERAISEAAQKGYMPMLVGGTGFYIQAVVRGIRFDGDEGADEDFRERMNSLSVEELYSRLREKDPDYAAQVHPHNRQRVIRALEYCEHTGETFSDYNRREALRQDQYETAFYVLTDDREKLYERIDRRAAYMVGNGLIEEVLALRKAGLTTNHQSMRTLGYRETMEALEAADRAGIAMPDKKALAEEIALHTRHYAKRRLTWFRREPQAAWFSLADMTQEEIADAIVRDLREREIFHDRRALSTTQS